MLTSFMDGKIKWVNWKTLDQKDFNNINNIIKKHKVFSDQHVNKVINKFISKKRK